MEIKVVKVESPEIFIEEKSEFVEDKHINELTMQFMMNRELYENYILSKQDQTISELKEERNFYRSRIFQLAKVLLLNEEEREKYYSLNPSFQISQISFDVFSSFDHFVKMAIHNFKINDTNEIFKNDIVEESPEITVSEYKEYVAPKQKTLDKFLIKNSTEEPITYPEQKNVNIRDKSFKKKGLRKFQL
jgi:hypothetical protein